MKTIPRPAEIPPRRGPCRPIRRVFAATVLVLLGGITSSLAHAETPTTEAARPYELTLRTRVADPGGGPVRTVERPATWDPARTAVIVCDVWDLHTSKNATLRTGELVPRIAALTAEVRRRGGTVIHSPSDTMATYEGHPARALAASAPPADNPPPEIAKWCYQIPAEADVTYPLDQSDGGGDDDPAEQAAWRAELAARGRKTSGPWLSEHPGIPIEPGDYVTDRGVEVWNVLESKKVEHVLLVGVHTNMCVLGRPFGLRRLTEAGGRDVVLVRDLTDTMYNPASWPYVSHFTGTDRIVEHIERTVCPTITSDQLLGGTPFTFAGDARPHVVMMVSEVEYHTERTLPAFAARRLGRDFRVTIVHGDPADGSLFPGLATALVDADVLLVSVRRRTPLPEALAAVRSHVEAGRPVLGLRTASHAFSLRNQPTPDGRAVWPSWDADVFGGHYTNHHGAGPTTEVTIVPGREGSPLLTGVTPFASAGSLYKVSPLAASATPLLTGTIPGQTPEPVAWTNTTAFGGPAFYTSLGHEGDFAEPAFERLLVNALHVLTGQAVPTELADSPPTPPKK